MASPFTPEQQSIIDFVFKTLNGQLEVVTGILMETRRDLLALAALITRKGVEIDADEWSKASNELAAAHQVELAFDPRVSRGEEFLARIMRGEEIPEEEMNQWLRDVHGGAA